MLQNNKIKKSIVDKFQRNSKDTGSPEVQIAILTTRINTLTEHFKLNKKDNHSKVGMIKLISRRKNLISYLKKQDVKKYEKLIKELNLRK